MSFELLIKEHYPFLDYILKNIDAISGMADFHRVVSFAN
jgi:hypothetical protein